MDNRNENGSPEHMTQGPANNGHEAQPINRDGSKGAHTGTPSPPNDSPLTDGEYTSGDSSDDPDPSPAVPNLEVDAEDDRSISNYAYSTYPHVRDHFHVDYPHHNTYLADNGTIDTSRTLYAEDIDYVFEHGRRYCGDYSMPNDDTEQTRQYVAHQVYLKLFDGRLTTVPLSHPRYILDIGTGIGEWAIGIAEAYPNCEVFGTDIAAIQPTDQVPLNVEFHIEDAEEEWIRPVNTVDLVHIRNMAGAFRDWSFVYEQAFACIKPGGYIEVLDFDDHRSYENFVSWFPEGSAMSIILDALFQASALNGRPKGTGHMHPQLLLDAGFVDIENRSYDIPIGRQENPKFGEDWLFVCVTGVEATCLRLLTKHLGWDPEYVRSLCDEVSHEIKKVAEDPDRAKGYVVKLKVMTGRKPEWNAQSLAEDAAGRGDPSKGDESTIGSSVIRSVTTQGTRPESQTSVEQSD